MRRKLQHRLPCRKSLGLVAGALVRLGLAQPGHEIAPVDIDCSVERSKLALIVA